MSDGEYQALRDVLESGFDALHQRIDELKEDHHRMHGENSRRLDAINGKVNEAHRLIAVLQNIVAGVKDSLESAWKAIRGGGNKVSREDVRWIFALIGLGGGLVALAFKLAGKW